MAGSERSGLGHPSKLLIEKTDKFSLIESIDEAAHQSAKISGSGGDGVTVTGYIGEEQASNASGGAT